MIGLTKSFFASLKPVTIVPSIFLLLIFLLNNAWFTSLLFGEGRSYAVATFCLLSLAFLLISKLFFSLGPLLLMGSLFSFYLLLGVLNNSLDVTGFIMVITFWLNCFVVYTSLKRLGYDNVIHLCRSLIVWQFLFLVFVDLFNWLIRARGLPIVIETIVPVSIFGIFLLHFLSKNMENFKRFYLLIGLCFIYFTISILADYSLNEKKIQKIQFGLIGFSALYFLFLRVMRPSLLKGKLLGIFTPIRCLVVIAVAIVINFITVTQTLVLLQPSSGYLRFAINVAMLNDLTGSSIVFGKGLGSAWKLFDVAELHPAEFLFEFDAMYPHSGLVVMLYEYGIFGLVVFGVYSFKYLLLPSKANREKYRSSFGNRLFSSWLWLGLLAFFLMQNGMYVQGIPSGDVYFQSNFVFYVMFAWLIIMSRTKCDSEEKVQKILPAPGQASPVAPH